MVVSVLTRFKNLNQGMGGQSTIGVGIDSPAQIDAGPDRPSLILFTTWNHAVQDSRR